MPVPDVEAVPNPRLGEEGSFPLLCSARTRNKSLQMNPFNKIFPTVTGKPELSPDCGSHEQTSGWDRLIKE